MIEITLFEKEGGILSKRIALAEDGTLKADGSACVMSRGKARRCRLDDLADFAARISALSQSQAICAGSLRPELPDQVEVTTKSGLSGEPHPNLIARDADTLLYRPGKPALVLLDFDTKGIPGSVANTIETFGGFWPALVSVMPELAGVGQVERRSTSAALYRTDTGQAFDAGGLHVYIVIEAGTDSERFLRTLHSRCWLAGLGWHLVGAGGQLLERSIIDRMVGSPERLIFEAPPLLQQPLAQGPRDPIITEGPMLDTLAACPPLTVVERARLREMRERAAVRLAPEVAKARETFVRRKSERLVERKGMTPTTASRIAARWCNGILLPDVELAFDDEGFADATVADILADPERFAGATLADPLEGPEYGICKAKVMRRADGTPWINSFAHGRTVYELKIDFTTARAALQAASEDSVADRFVHLVIGGDLEIDEVDRLRDLAADRTGIGKRILGRKLKDAVQKRRAQLAEEQRQHQAAERRDSRPRIRAPHQKAPWLPQMTILNEVLGTPSAAEPPTRDLEGSMCAVHARRLPGTHLLTPRGVNEGDHDETRLAAPRQPLLYQLDESELAELIERHIDYVDPMTGGSVHLSHPFVRHYLRRRNDPALPVVTGVTTIPLLLPRGPLRTGPGLDRHTGIIFRIPSELLRMIPERPDCTPDAVGKAMHFLCDEWLADVATDYEGKVNIIAFALTIIERMVLPERPAFIVVSGRRGSGKTTTIIITSMAVLGHRATAAAWSRSEEERRKSLFAHLASGVPLITWDNIPRGTAISCPSIERALTAYTYTDRILGLSEQRTVPATTIMALTGNNISPRGDFASRSLMIRLSVDRTDPENRLFRHVDPVAWTEAHRGEILRALYMILLGNPPRPAETRFKEWHRLVGSAVEHGSEQHIEYVAERVKWHVDDKPVCPPKPIRFRDLFQAGEAEEEQAGALAIVLNILRVNWPNGCTAATVADFISKEDDAARMLRGAIETATGSSIRVVSAHTMAWRLKALNDTPAEVDGTVLVLRYLSGHEGGTFHVRDVKERR